MVNRLRAGGAALFALALGLMLAGLPALAFAQTSGDDGTGAALFGGSIVSCICGLIGLLITIGLAYWVYTDAKKRGNPNAILWAVLTFFFTLLGLILYFLIGRNQGTTSGTPPSTPGGAARY